jgi:hypothetical protein
VAVSWNAPGSPAADGNCNFKCSAAHQAVLQHEQGVLVRPRSPALCDAPPPPRSFCPPGIISADWKLRCEGAQLAYSPVLAGPTAGLMPEVGNGHVASVVGSDTIFAAGLFNGDAKGAQAESTYRARVPAYRVAPAMPPTTGGSRGGGGGYVETGERAMDFERAAFVRRSTFRPASATAGKGGQGGGGGCVVGTEQRWFAPYTEPRLLVHEIDLWVVAPAADGAPCVVALVAELPTPSKDIALAPVPAAVAGEEYAVAGYTRIAEDASLRNVTAVAFAANVLPASVTLPSDTTDTTVGQGVAAAAAATKKLTLRALSVVVTSLNSTDVAADALATLRAFTGGTGAAMAAALRPAHEAAWAARADGGHLEVEGDLGLALALNASLYYIRASIREDWPQGLSPGGLASNGYHGHTFWDQETWMWPPLLMLDPGCAASALQYRFDRLGTARAKAAACGEPNESYCQPGYAARVAPEATMFPWESAALGVEAQFGGGKIGHWGVYEQHISGDIALAVRQYWYTTGDRRWLRDVGFPIANGTASFYAARVEPAAGNASSGAAFVIKGAMGPDEYAYPVDDSAYTNAVAAIALSFAAEAAAELGHAPAPCYDDFRRKAAGLVILVDDAVPTRPDLVGGYHPEYRGFPKDLQNPTVKQADTIMLAYPLGVAMDARVLANDLSFYNGITDPNGPAMTWAMFAIGWFNVGNFTASQPLFRRGFANVQPPFDVWTETPGGGTVNFITGAGGFLQSVIFGTSGMRIARGALNFDPPPPSATGTNATKITVHSFHYLGNRLRQEVTADAVTYELLGGGDGSAQALALDCRFSTSKQPLEVGKPLTGPRDKCSIAVAAK